MAGVGLRARRHSEKRGASLNNATDEVSSWNAEVWDDPDMPREKCYPGSGRLEPCLQIVPRPASLEIRSGWDAAMAATLTGGDSEARGEGSDTMPVVRIRERQPSARPATWRRPIRGGTSAGLLSSSARGDPRREDASPRGPLASSLLLSGRESLPQATGPGARGRPTVARGRTLSRRDWSGATDRRGGRSGQVEDPGSRPGGEEPFRDVVDSKLEHLQPPRHQRLAASTLRHVRERGGLVLDRGLPAATGRGTPLRWIRSGILRSRTPSLEGLATGRRTNPRFRMSSQSRSITSPRL